jgi:hypothetical protein
MVAATTAGAMSASVAILHVLIDVFLLFVAAGCCTASGHRTP